jgi:hypothetical protein
MLSVVSAELEVDRKKFHKEIDKLFVSRFAEELYAKRDIN